MWSFAATAQDSHMHGSNSSSSQLAATATFDAHGHLWVVWAEGQHVMVRRSDDFGKTLGKPIIINAIPEPI